MSRSAPTPQASGSSTLTAIKGNRAGKSGRRITEPFRLPTLSEPHEAGDIFTTVVSFLQHKVNSAFTLTPEELGATRSYRLVWWEKGVMYSKTVDPLLTSSPPSTNT